MIHPLRAALVCLAALGGCVWGCHAIVGADEFTVDEPAAGGATGSTSSSGGSTTTSAGAGGTGGGAGGADLCHPSGLEDDFDGDDFGPLWQTWGNLDTLGVANGRGYLQASAWTERNGGIYTVDEFDLTGCAVWAEIRQVPDSSTGAGVQFVIWVNDANHAAFGVEEGRLWYVVWDSGVNLGGNTLPYDASAHHWLRFRHDGSRLRLEVSSDTAVWTELMDVDAPSWIDHVEVNLNLNVWASNDHLARFVFDNLNRPL